MRYLFIYLMVSVSGLIVLSCSDTEDSNIFRGKEYMVNNEGYLPLSPKNQWIYKTYSATENDQGVIVYDDENDYDKSERFIADAKVLSTKSSNSDEQNYFISYEFSPIANSGLIGGLLGNFHQVVKDFDTGEYYRTEIKKFKVEQDDTGKVESKFELKLSDVPFLLDEVTDLDVGKVLDYELKTIEHEIGIPVKLVYERTTKIQGKYDKIPPQLASTVGVDDHLLQFNDIVQVRDEFRIVEISASVKTVNVYLDLNATLKEGESTATLNAADKSGSTGKSSVFAITDIFNIPGIDFGIPVPWQFTAKTYNHTDLTIRIKDFLEELSICEATLNYRVNSAMDVPIEIHLSKDVPYYQDTYYARGVGIIKTVTNNKMLEGEIRINPNLEALDLGNLYLEPTDPECAERRKELFCADIWNPLCTSDLVKNNRANIQAEIEPHIESFKSNSPFAAGEPSVRVSNISAYKLNNQ